MKFACEQIQERWAEYLYRELDEPELAQFAQHIQRCSICRQEEARWRNLFSRFDVMATADQTLEVPTELVFRVNRQIHLYEDWANERVAQFRNWLVGSLAACMMIACTGWLAMEQIPKWMQLEGLQSLKGTYLKSVYMKRGLEMDMTKGVFNEMEKEDLGIAARDPQKPANDEPETAAQERSS